MPSPVRHTPLLQAGEFKVVEVKDFNFFDLAGDRAKTKGSSNKSYHAEIQLANDSSGKAQIFTMWGATGSALKEDWRHFDSEFACRKEFNRIIKSKIKKGYVEIEVAQRVIGSEDAKKIVKPVVFSNVDQTANATQSKLDINVQKLVKRLFGATQSFVATTLKCPLGQLTNNQIDEGRKRLNQAKVILNAVSGKLGKKDLTSVQDLTNEFYSLIPHNLGHGSRGKMEELLLDNLQKIMKKEEDLDILLDAKSVGAVFNDANAIDSQYNSLNANIEYVDPTSQLFNWINSYFLESRAKNHSALGKIKIHNVWKLLRNGEDKRFISAAEKIAKEYGNQNIPSSIKKFVASREDVDKELNDVYKRSNVLPVFHGTRTENVSSIANKGLLIRPSGAVYTGSALGDAIYWAFNSTKSINYSSARGTYWANGSDKTAFMFLADVAFGKQRVVDNSRYFSLSDLKRSGEHSVWAKAGYGFYNDELTTYVQSGPGQQHILRYLIEFETQA